MMGQAARTARLLDAAFAYNPPIWRMGFDAHVRDWRRHISRECFARYYTSPGFAAEHDARLAEQRNTPLPAWGLRIVGDE
jgi:hypothetical protein